MKLKTVLVINKDRNPENSSSLQTLYNAKKKIIKEDQDGRQKILVADDNGR